MGGPGSGRKPGVNSGVHREHPKVRSGRTIREGKTSHKSIKALRRAVKRGDASKTKTGNYGWTKNTRQSLRSRF